MSYEDNIINHVRVLHVQKSNSTNVLLDTRSGGGGVEGPIVAGLPLTESVDDSLDTFTFTIKATSRKTPYRPFDRISVGFYDEQDKEPCHQKNMLVLSDHVQTLSRQFGTYTHTVTAIESTKILEKVKIFNLNLTNPYDTLYDQFRKALTNAEPVLRSKRIENGNTVMNFERQCRFSISPSLYALLQGKPGEDFYNGNTDLRTVLDNLLAPLNARVEVTNISCSLNRSTYSFEISNITLGYRSMTATRVSQPVWTREAHGAIVCEELMSDAQDKAGTIVARGYNTLSRETMTFSDTFKSGNDTISDESACVFFPFPISEMGIKSFLIRDIPLAPPPGSSTSSKATVDISRRIIPKEKFDLLSEKDQKHYLPYSIGESILNVGSYVSYTFIWAKSGIKTIIEDMLLGLNPGSYDYHTLPFTITYYPQINNAIELSKPNVYDKDELLLGITDNQSENTLDMQRHGRRLKSLIRRTGNDAYYIDVIADHFKNLLPLKAKINMSELDGELSGDYVVYKRECAIYDMFVKCRYYLSKGYTHIQEKAGVRREKHLYDIPLESDECPLVIRKFMVFGFNKSNYAEYGYRSEFVSSALQTLVGTNLGRIYDVNGTQKTSTGRVRYLLLSSVAHYSDGFEDTFPSDDKLFMLPTVTYGQGTTMNFVARTLDNYSVNYSRDGYKFSLWGYGGYKIVYNRYVSNEANTAGECAKFNLSLAFEYGVLKSPESFSDYESIMQGFPVVKDSSFAKCMDNPIEFDYYKDRTQRPLFCLIMECIPTSADYGNIFIGSAFCRDNNLVHENGSGLQGLKLVISHSKTIDDDECLPDGFLGNYTVSEYFAVNIESGAAAARLEYKGGLGDDIKAWAIVNGEGEIYLAANGAPRTIYAWIMDFPK